MKNEDKIDILVESEIGALEAVLLHRPGMEVENMEPENAEKALYSDILNLSVAQEEYAELFMVLSQTARTFEIRNMLSDVLQNESTRPMILSQLLEGECGRGLYPENLADLSADDLSCALIEGIWMERNSLANFLSEETFSVKPLHNFLFIRDTAMAIGDRILLGKMASRVRRREARIMNAVFSHHPLLKTLPINPGISPGENAEISIEGGDVLTARRDVLVVGIGNRTTPEGIDFIAAHFGGGAGLGIRHIIVQELPHTLESFIHLDMVFTFLDRDLCMVFEPLILKNHRFKPIHITVDNGRISVVREEENLLKSLAKLGMSLKPVACGGEDERHQRREQWHSGANFFAIAPGKIVGYARNEHTLDALHREGFEILSAKDVITGRADMHAYEKCVIAVKGSELARGGGGCRCLTLPIRRKPV